MASNRASRVAVAFGGIAVFPPNASKQNKNARIKPPMQALNATPMPMPHHLLYSFSIRHLKLSSLNAPPVFMTLIKHGGRKNSSSDVGKLFCRCLLFSGGALR
jgi:hypothetical protein